jgi:RNA polymerase-associated protein
MTAASRRSVMTLFSGPTCPDSHRIRFMLAEKSITPEIVWVSTEPPEDLLDLNPYGTVPTLVDRDVALYSAGVICEYLDERFPHPPLMPVDPVSRAKARLVLYRVEQDWYAALRALDSDDAPAAEEARKRLSDGLTAAAELFAESPFFLSDDMTVMDCMVVPLLWRLPHHGVSLPKQARAIFDYADRMFARESFQRSLSEAERALRP